MNDNPNDTNGMCSQFSRGWTSHESRDNQNALWK